MKTLLITRPREEAQDVADAVAALGYSSFIEPLLYNLPLLHSRPALEAALARKPQALLVTSKRALEAFTHMTPERSIPIIAVGEATSQVAAQLGFTVLAWGETAQAVTALVPTLCAPQAGPLLYARGQDIRSDIAADLALQDFDVDSVVLYRAMAAPAFSDELRLRMRDGLLQAALFFSRRTAEIYNGLVRSNGLTEPHRAMQAVCMSDHVAVPLLGLPWQGMLIARQPTSAQMIAEIQNLA